MQKKYDGLNKTVATNLKRIRLDKGLSQEGLSERCGVHRTYVGAIERFERNITLKTLELLAHGLNVGALDLMVEDNSVL